MIIKMLFIIGICIGIIGLYIFIEGIKDDDIDVVIKILTVLCIPIILITILVFIYGIIYL